MSSSEGGVAQDLLNRATWSRSVMEFVTEGWEDRGELAMLTDLADEFRGQALLDIGVGAGRTVPLLRLLTADYVAVDYTPEMVQLCAQRYPGIDVRHDDARTLLTVPDMSTDLVIFSANGIDAVGHSDRGKVLDAVHRVLRPGGVFAFSTLNRDGAFFGATPADAPDTWWLPGSLEPRPSAVERAHIEEGDDVTWTRAVRNWRSIRGSTDDRGDWAVAPFAAQEFALLVHFVTVSEMDRELGEHGFTMERIFPCDSSIPLTDKSSDALYFNVIARAIPADA